MLVLRNKRREIKLSETILLSFYISLINPDLVLFLYITRTECITITIKI